MNTRNLRDSLFAWVSVLSALLLLFSGFSAPAWSEARIGVFKKIVGGGPVDFGGTATFEITVTNKGDVTLSNVLVSDDAAPDCGGYLQSKGGPNALLPNEAFRYQCMALNVQSDFTNRARAIGQFQNGDQCISGSTSRNSGRVTVVVQNEPSIDIRKQQEGNDSRTFPIGSDVDFEIEVTNDGDLPLSDVVVVDPKAADCEALIGNLGLGESANFTCIEPDVVNTFNNTATATGRVVLVGGDPLGCEVSDYDRSLVNVEDLQCAVLVTKQAEPDTIVRTPPPDCDTIPGSKPQEILFRYTGGGCGASDNDQGEKAECTGMIDDTLEANVLVDDDKLGVVGSPVAPGDTFTVSGTFPSNSIIELGNGGGMETNEIHTSCSQPLAVGDVFGSLTVAGLDGQTSSGNEVLFTYSVTNLGDDAEVTLTDDVLGPIPEPGQNVFNLLNGQSEVFEVTAAVNETTTNKVTASASLLDDPDITCMSMAMSTVTVEDPPKTCDDGKPTALVFEYTGESCAASNNGQGSKAVCSGDPAGSEPVEIVMTRDGDQITVSPAGEALMVNGLVNISRDDGNRFASETEFDIRQDGQTLQSLNIHTSCSQPLNVGDQFGSMILREFVPQQAP